MAIKRCRNWGALKRFYRETKQGGTEMRQVKLLVGVVTLVLVGQAQTWAQEGVPVSGKLGGQVFFRGGAAFLTGGGRGGEVFTDAGGAAGLTNDETVGFSVGFGLNPAANERFLVRQYYPR